MKKLIFKIMIPIMISSSLSAKNTLTNEQIEIAFLSQIEGFGIVASDGTDMSNIALGMVSVESVFGKFKVGDKNLHGYNKSYGLLHIRLVAYNDVIKKYPYLKLESNNKIDVTDALKNDDIFNLSIGLHYLLIQYEIALKKGYKKPMFRAIGRYNGGWSNQKYPKKVLSMIEKHNDLLIF